MGWGWLSFTLFRAIVQITLTNSIDKETGGCWIKPYALVFSPSVLGPKGDKSWRYWHTMDNSSIGVWE